ncbi:MAG: hypothetical protein Q8O64_09395 [Sideroxyarcus sp.]|nr:hypothetical protein [Sideroxyarcus sp.]
MHTKFKNNLIAFCAISLILSVFFWSSAAHAGYLTNSVCYPTEVEAVDAHFSSIKPILWARTSAIDVFHDVSYSSGFWLLNEYTVNDGGSQMFFVHSIPFPVPTFPLCDEAGADPIVFANSFYWGMSTVLIFGFLGLTISVAKSAIQQV